MTVDRATATPPGAEAPLARNAIVILLDSLNRHHVGAYGGTEFDTPNLDRFARRALRFTRHFTGSLPCMPARHDLLCGAYDFLWKPWGSIEVWEDAVTYPLRRAGVATMLVSDHPHLFETGGENYHTDFTAWDYQRGHESDPWKTRPDPSWAGAPSFGRGWTPYDDSRGWFGGEEDFPGPRTMRAAARWIDEHLGRGAYQARGADQSGAAEGACERFLLFVDEFDPHEPFDTPEPWASRYDPEWSGAHLIWPPYRKGAIADGVIDARQGRQIRAQYGAKLSMIDHWLGEILDALDRHALWDDTLVVVCTDHGHYLGERDVWGKPAVPVQRALGHIPLLIAAPGVAAGDVDALTTSVDLFATVADLFGVTVRQRTHGRSLLPLVRGTASSVRDWALTGVWGREVSVVDGRWSYARAPAGVNAPLSLYSNRWSTMPLPNADQDRWELFPPPDARAWLDRMPGSEVPVIRQPFDAQDRIAYWARARFDGNHLYDFAAAPGEEPDVAGDRALERRMTELLRAALEEVEAPDDQLARLGLD
jgi:arylsulfatase A-like enzyme